ncbi:MAG: trimethylamine methyltransferase family protein [Anaerolineales bacterium]|nr:trimethylamine methyltransferase family protein [Anaerolineales bacterium]
MTERRSTRRGQRAESPLLKLPFRQLRNPLKPLEILTPEQVEKVHEASMRILEETGLLMMDAEALSLWQAAGAQVDHKAQHVRLDRGLVLELVAKAPRSFTWRARDPAKSVTVGENYITFAPQGGVAYATDLDYGRRRGSLRDYQNFLKLIQMSGPLHYAGEQVMALYDVENSLRHLTRLSNAITLTDKALMEAAHGRVVTEDSLHLARLVFGDIEAGGPVIGGVINASSPLRYDQRMLGGLITYARAGQVNIITPFILAGAMSPISIAAAVAQQNAEALAGVALTQLVRPGAPVLYGGFTTNVDMKSGSPAMGTPEGAWALLAGAQLARRYGLPYRGSGSLNTSKTPDAESVMETQWTLWPAVLAHTNFIMHSVGWLEGGLCASYEKFIIDLESLAMFYHFLNGFEISNETLALDMIAQVGPGGHHFDTPHTQARYATEFYQSFLAERAGYETWLAQGGRDAAQRANALWKEMLAAYQPPPLDPGVREAVADYVARRTRELEGKSLYE